MMEEYLLLEELKTALIQATMLMSTEMELSSNFLT
jgi:hypothetical protein